eukprot:CAMPEP_0118823510 /NCGR_PEP_ID=MMETSP1162-20130426/9966_1 /TAXON_ID=33656 /ORGANISM="Phaeocystis Sp, Strain CCMP2710" /LENGTH=96 /DNA_ID=CAMNT_0006754123 /DNA_START=513 /DNA_END=803 /DNA_ORIENTATION=+
MAVQRAVMREAAESYIASLAPHDGIDVEAERPPRLQLVEHGWRGLNAAAAPVQSLLKHARVAVVAIVGAKLNKCTADLLFKQTKSVRADVKLTSSL